MKFCYLYIFYFYKLYNSSITHSNNLRVIYFSRICVKKRWSSHLLDLFRKRRNVCKNNSKSMHNSIQSNQTERIKSTFQTKSGASICELAATNFSLKSWKIIVMESFYNICIILYRLLRKINLNRIFLK